MKNTITVATHAGIFHADEVSAIALLKIFNPDATVIVNRYAHQTPVEDMEPCDFIIDTGKVHDGVKRFDHHQYEGGKSSAGLIWDHIKETCYLADDEYPSIDKLVELVDANDVGDRKAELWEYSRLVGNYNSPTPYDDLEQHGAFHKALDFATVTFKALKKSDEDFALAESKVAHSDTLEELPCVLDLGTYTPNWQRVVTGLSEPDVYAVIWFVPEKDQWNVQVPAKIEGSYDLHGRRLRPSDKMVFVHATGFFGVAPDKETLIEYLKALYSDGGC